MLFRVPWCNNWMKNPRETDSRSAKNKSPTLYGSWKCITCSQEPTIQLYSQPAKSSSQPISLRSILILSFHLHLRFVNGNIPSRFLTTYVCFPHRNIPTSSTMIPTVSGAYKARRYPLGLCSLRHLPVTFSLSLSLFTLNSNTHNLRAGIA